MLWVLAFVGFIMLLPSLLMLAALGIVVVALPLVLFFTVWFGAALFLFLLLWPGSIVIDLLAAFAIGLLVARCFPPRARRCA